MTFGTVAEIGDKFGPIDFSMIPIWRGGSLSFLAWAGLKVGLTSPIPPSFLHT